MSKNWGLFVLGIAFVAGGLVQADAANPAPATLKVGYVDLQRTLNETPVGKAAKKKLEGDKEKKQAELKKKEKELMDSAAELDKQRSMLKPDVLRQREQELQQRYVGLQELVMQLQQELAKQEATLVREIFNKAQPAIAEIAKSQGYTLILEKNESAVLFAADGLDITTAVNQKVK